MFRRQTAIWLTVLPILAITGVVTATVVTVRRSPARALERARQAIKKAERQKAQGPQAGNEWDRAEGYLEAVLSRFPHHAEARLLSARVATGRRDFARALERLAEIPDSDPLGAEARLREGEILYHANRGAEAEVALRRRLALTPDCIQARRLLVALYRLEDRESEAAALLWQLYEAAPGELKIEPLKELFLAQFAMYVDGAAVRRLQLMVEENPDDIDAEVAIGSRLYKGVHKGGDPEAAKQLLAKCLERRPDHLTCRANLARCHMDLGEYEQVAQLLAEWPEPVRDTRYWRLNGLLQQDYQADYAGAVESYRKVLAAEPEDYKICHRLGQCLQFSGQTEQAQVELSRAAKLRESNNYVYNRTLIRETIPRVNSDAALRHQVGRFYEDLGRHQEAACWYGEALRLRPGDGSSRAALDRMKATVASRSSPTERLP